MPSPRSDPPPGALTLFVRYGIGLLTVAAGFVCLAFNFGGFGIEELFAFAGAGLSILLVNFLFRMGVASDREHEEHEAAWRFYERHGHWPDEAPPSDPAHGARRHTGGLSGRRRRP